MVPTLPHRHIQEARLVLHVDVVRNQGASGRQVRIAVLHGDESGVKVETDDSYLESMLKRSFDDPDTGDEISPEEHPVLFMRRLHAVLNGSVLFATRAYEDPMDSPFLHSDSIPMRSVAV